jgi:Zn-dependent M28 family amino/carboxypeptidase
MTHAHPSRRTRFLATSAAGLLAVAGTLATAAPAAAGGDNCEHRNNDTISKLLECVNGAGVKEHLTALQEIADANGGTRASGTKGFTESADYVEERLEDAGYEVTRQPFDFAFYQVVGTPTFAQVTPTPTSYAYSTDGTAGDFQDMSYSGSGTVTGTLVPVDVAGADSGCEAADFTAAVSGQVALIKRGTCDFGVKATNAEAAGATAAIIYNDGADPSREGLIGGTLGAPVGIPVLDTTFALGSELATGTRTVSIGIETVNETRSTENVIAELPGRADHHDVIGVGGHLDSVEEGPGINDNGSGSATILELAENLAGARPENGVRFFWWGAEEAGLFGSQHYVDSLPPGQLKKISAYLNFDMLASPNFGRFVYDGDGSTFEAPPGYVTPESAAIETIFETFYDSYPTKLGGPLAYEDTEFDGRSDYQAFADAGIPSGGLFSGAEVEKTAEQVARYGGTAGVPFDSCYHQACDDIGNIDATALDQNADAVAYAVLTLALQGDQDDKP